MKKEGKMSEYNDYDIGHLNDYDGEGGGFECRECHTRWQDYIREEIGKCNKYWRKILYQRDDIIEKQREIIRNDENYLGHARACYSNETRECVCGLIEYLNKRKVILKLTEE